MSLRLAYMTGQYPRATDTFIQQEVAQLRRLGHHVQTFSVRKPPETEDIGPEITSARQSTIYLLPPRGVFGAHLAQLLSSPGKYFAAVALAWTTCPPGLPAVARQIAYFAEAGILARLMKRHALPHLHNHFADSSCSVAAIAATMGGFTFSFTMHGTTEFYDVKRWWIDRKIRQALFVNCVSHFGRSQAMLFSPADCWEKLQLVHCGVDPASFAPKTHTGIGTKLLFIGRLAPEKGLPVLFEAVARLDGVTLDVIGDGPDRKMLEERARALNMSRRVRFHGYQTQQQVREFLRLADVFAVASFTEGVPIALMEAMAAGVPVVATCVGGIPELVRDEQTGLLVLPGDADAAANAIRRLLEDPGLRHRLATAGRKKIEQDFDIEAECRKLAAILTRALTGKAGPV